MRKPGSTMASFVVVLVAALAGNASAEPTPMSQQEFRDLLAGNTMVGEWAGKPYREFFTANGAAIYLQKGGAETRGTWRIKSDGRFCSVWPPSARETCYTVQRDGDTLLWDNGRGAIYPAEIEAGKRMSW